MTSDLLTDRHGSCVELTLNRPACRNALSRTLIAELTAALRQVAADSAVRTVILTGAPPAFCAGLDLREVAEAADEFDNAPLLDLLETIEQLPQPVIAAVNGPAMAGGAALVTACDLAVTAESATLGYPGIRRGLVAPLVLTYLRRVVSERHVRCLLLTGESISARRAAEIGLVTDVVPDAELFDRVRQVAAQLAANPRNALFETKALLRRTRGPCFDAAAARQRDALVRKHADPR